MLNFSVHKTSLLFFITILLCACQKENPEQGDLNTQEFVQNPGDGGGFFEETADLSNPKESCISEAEAKRLDDAVEKNIHDLKQSGVISEAISRAPVKFSWPLRKANGLRDPGYYTITNYVDHNPNGPDRLTDYRCGKRTYDTPSYNHSGTDIALFPFQWDKMDRNHVHVIAGAPGHIVYKQSNRYDKNCTWNGQGANGIIIRHSDGSRSTYWHLKKNSTTSKGVGSYVKRGEFLGIVGSSGISTNPHLHFEIKNSSGKIIDPYGGNCNRSNGSTSYWANQKPYVDTGLNALKTHSAKPIFRDCPQKAIRNEQNVFNKGALVYLVGYFRHQVRGRNSYWKVIQPNGTVFWSWTYRPGTEGQPNFSNAWWRSQNIRLPSNARAGTWRFQINHMGKTSTHRFTVR